MELVAIFIFFICVAFVMAGGMKLIAAVIPPLLCITILLVIGLALGVMMVWLLRELL